MTEWLAREGASIPPAIGILLAVALLVSAAGFYKVVYFISIGYAFAIVAMALVTIALFRDTSSWVIAVQALLLIVWGVRLGVFLIQRERREAYRATIAEITDHNLGLSLSRRALIWVGVSLLYVAMFSPALFGAASGPVVGSAALVVQIAGLVVMAGGLILEALADKQKSDAKAVNPKRFCDVGLYRLVRCPNYLGEILFWLGNWIIGVPSYTSVTRAVIAFIGFACITLIMMGSTKRLERSQEERYGDLPEYLEYISRTPVLFPFLPIYTLKNVRVFIE